MRSDTLVALPESLNCRLGQVALPPLDGPDAFAVSSFRILALGWMLDARLVRNDASGCVHKPLTFSHDVARKALRTACRRAVAESCFSTREVLATLHRHIGGSCLPGRYCCCDGSVIRCLYGCDSIWYGQLWVRKQELVFELCWYHCAALHGRSWGAVRWISVGPYTLVN
jgi:hypothetical protein